MNTIKTNLTLSPSYNNKFVKIQKKEYQLEFDLANGSHTVTTPLLEIGILPFFENKILQAQLSFKYDYDEERGMLTVAGPEYRSEDSMTLITVPKGTDEYCYQTAGGLRYRDGENELNPHWNYATPMTPGLEEAFIKVVKDASVALIEALREEKKLIIHTKTNPPELSPEDHSKLLLVYKNGAFHEFYNPEKAYGEDFSIKTVESVWGGTTTFPWNTNFANVIGSTHDPKINGYSWIGLWRSQFGNPDECASYQYQGFPCNNSLVGGHIILGQHAEYVPPGVNYVYIIPICKAHNNNDNVYMATVVYNQAIHLQNYLGT